MGEGDQAVVAAVCVHERRTRFDHTPPTLHITSMTLRASRLEPYWEVLRVRAAISVTARTVNEMTPTARPIRSMRVELQARNARSP